MNQLPVRGQRTWTNKNSIKTNQNLKIQKISILKNYLNIENIQIINNYIFLEYINLLWKLQWTSEWLELKKKRLFFLKKKIKNLTIKVDKQIILEELTYLRSKFLKKKNKTNFKKSYTALGFDPGFGFIFFK